MKTLFLFLFCLLVPFTFCYSQTQNHNKTKVYIHKQTGKMYAESDIFGNFGSWTPQGLIYLYKQTEDTIFNYIDDEFNFSQNIDSIETQNLNKYVDLGDMLTIDGQVINQDSLRGKVVVLNIWGTWCTPCIKEIPELNILAQNYTERDVIFLAPAVRSRNLDRFSKQIIFDYLIIPDGDKIAAIFTNSFPTNIVIDKEGIVRFVLAGTDEEPMNEKLSKEIEKYL